MPSILRNRRTNYANHYSAYNCRTGSGRYGAIGEDARCNMRGEVGQQVGIYMQRKTKRLCSLRFYSVSPTFCAEGLSINTSKGQRLVIGSSFETSPQSH